MLAFLTSYAQKTFFFVHANIPICMLSVTSNETAHWELGHKLPLALMNMCCPLLFGTWLSNVLSSSSAGERASHYQQPLEIRNILEKLIWTQRFPALASFSHDSILKNKLERSFSPLSQPEWDCCVFTATSVKDFCTALPPFPALYFTLREARLGKTSKTSCSNHKTLQFVKRNFSAMSPKEHVGTKVCSEPSASALNTLSCQ